MQFRKVQIWVWLRHIVEISPKIKTSAMLGKWLPRLKTKWMIKFSKWWTAVTLMWTNWMNYSKGKKNSWRIRWIFSRVNSPGWGNWATRMTANFNNFRLRCKSCRTRKFRQGRRMLSYKVRLRNFLMKSMAFHNILDRLSPFLKMKKSLTLSFKLNNWGMTTWIKILFKNSSPLDGLNMKWKKCSMIGSSSSIIKTFKGAQN